MASHNEFHALLRNQLPDKDVALVGWDATIAFLHSLHIRKRSGDALTRRIVRGWSRRHGFPFLKGRAYLSTRVPPVTTTFAVTAWLLSQPDADTLFRPYPPRHVNTQHSVAGGCAPTPSARAA